MSKIRSAWEIALEKTEGIEVDRDKIRHDEDLRKARELAGRFLSDDEEVSTAELKEGYKALPAKEAHEGVVMSVMQNLVLNIDPVSDERYAKLRTLASLASKGSQEALALFDQVTAFLKQFPEHRKQLFEQLKQRFAPAMQQKSEEMRQRYGQDVALSAERDPEFIKLAQQQLDRLAAQYEENLAEAKKELEGLL